MMINRSVPEADVIPELAYPDVARAAAWLCATFGFRMRLRIGDHRVQLLFGRSGAMVVTQCSATHGDVGERLHSTMARVADAWSHHAHAVAQGARVPHPPTDYAYGEKQYNAQDPGGHVWTFTQTIADIDPASWGGELIEP